MTDADAPDWRRPEPTRDELRADLLLATARFVAALGQVAGVRYA